MKAVDRRVAYLHTENLEQGSHASWKTGKILKSFSRSWNFTKSGNVLEKILPVGKNSLRTKKHVNKYYACRRKLQLYKKKSTATFL